MTNDANLVAAVMAALDEDGALSRHLVGYETRPGQRAMAAAVCDAFRDGGTLIAEAGTGTGKTIAYLVPAILHGQRVLVSTGTKNLQDQIVSKDLPLLQQALGVPFTAVCMKGRSNYLCLHRFDQVRHSPMVRTTDQRRALGAIEAWLEDTATGDRAEIETLPEDLPFWADVSATAETCLGSDCPRYDDCFVTRMRQKAAEADIVVVNHHLLCADASVRQQSFGEVIPECGLAVIDEAHQLEDVATQYFGVTVSNYRVDELVRDAEQALGTKGLDREKASAIRRWVARVDERARALFLQLQTRRVEPEDPSEGRRVEASPRNSMRDVTGLFDERRRLTPAALEPLDGSGLALTDALEQIVATIGLAPEASEDLRAIGRRAAELCEALRFVLRAADASFVYFLEIRGRGIFLRAMPIDVAAIVRERLLDQRHATVLTSATLAVNGSFAYVRSRLGIDAAREIRLSSEFDHARQSLLYLPRRMPDPRSPSFAEHAAEEIRDVLGRTEGRAFVLFTSYATLRDVRARLAATLPYPLLVQGEGPRGRLIEQFRRTAHAVLLGTASFWQGVDVVGEALSCVIIDKLPFASPADPLVQARIEAIGEAGGNAFEDYQVPLAILTLLQGLGRLLRHREDRGVLVVLDPRLRTMRYGRRFLEALPPSPVTSDPGDISRFFAAVAG